MSGIQDIVDTLHQEYLPKANSQLTDLAQQLGDLGYLEAFDDQTSLINEQEVNTAMQQFSAEFKSAQLISSKELSQLTQIYGSELNHRLLQLCLDVDEGLTFKALPNFGDQDLKVRIIHYRLKLLGVYTNPVSTYYNATSYHGLTQLADMIGKSLLTTCNLLADLQQFTVKYIQHKGYSNPVSIFKINPATLSQLKGTDGKPHKLESYTGAFKRSVKRELTRYPEVFEQLKQTIFKRNDDRVDMESVNELAQNSDNGFVIRLIQIHQWMAGFYHGKLDGDLGPVTIQSLLQVIDSYNEAGDDINEKKALVVLVEKEGIVAFNTIFFLNKYKVEQSQSDKTIQTLESINASYQGASPEQQAAFNTNFHQGIANVRDGKSAAVKQGFLGRIFSGIKGFFKKIFRFAKRIFGWIAKAVGKVASFIGNFLKKIYEVIKEAAKHFIEGVKFLLGKTVVLSGNPNQNILTQFSSDSDVFNLAKNLDSTILNTHKSKVNEKVQSLKFSLLLIAMLFKTIRLLLLGAAVAWPIFLLKLAKSFKQLIDQYKQIQTT